jgi:hypothetical protein
MGLTLRGGEDRFPADGYAGCGVVALEDRYVTPSNRDALGRLLV